MKILVIDDKEMHQQSAIETLQGHEVTIAKSFDEAMRILNRRVEWQEVYRALGRPTPRGGIDMDAEFSVKEKELIAQIPIFDAVLTDMMMPMSEDGPASNAWTPELVPYGFVIALKASLAGAKFVAMVTDMNHHKGAMTAALDHIDTRDHNGSVKPNFVVNGAKCMFVHSPFVTDVVKDAPCRECTDNPGACAICKGTKIDQIVLRYKKKSEACGCTKTENPGKCIHCKGTTKADKKVWERKDWGRVLKDLTASA